MTEEASRKAKGVSFNWQSANPVLAHFVFVLRSTGNNDQK
jgi:hypothetical protein